MMNNYLSILEESLRKKIQVLTNIQDYNQKQQHIFQSEQIDMDKFDDYVEEKGTLIDEVAKLDIGFETLYDNVAEELKEHREEYAEQILILQELITHVTEISISIQAQEARNRKLVEDYFLSERANIRKGRQSSKAAYDYYKNMRKINNVSPQFMDKKN